MSDFNVYRAQIRLWADGQMPVHSPVLEWHFLSEEERLILSKIVGGDAETVTTTEALLSAQPDVANHYTEDWESIP